MLRLKIVLSEGYDQSTRKFVEGETVELELEHSLVSLSKWESHFEKPFLSNEDKSLDETLWYVKAMCLTPNIPDSVWDHLSKKNIEAINKHINAKMTATWFTESKTTGKSSETITAELVYFWMISWQIPFECQYWHFNRLLTLIKVCQHKNQPDKKMSRGELMQRHRSLNAKRRQEAAARAGRS